MNREFKKAIVFSLLVMVVLPIVVSLLVSGGFGMLATLFLFFVIDPTFTIGLGVFCGTDVKRCWFLPVLNALLYIAGCRLAFGFGKLDFLIYAAAYLGIGVAVMLIYSVLRRPEKW